MKLYVRTAESEESIPSGNVGIWWFYNNKVVGVYCPLSEGVEQWGYVQFSNSENHMTMWEDIIEEQLPEATDMIPLGYRSIERGRVVYDARSQVYEIICSEKIASDNNAIQLIAKEFNISDLRYEVEPSSHYYVPHFTNNPTLDNFDCGD